MISPTLATIFLSALAAPALAEKGATPSVPSSNLLPAATATSDPLDRNISTVDIILDSSTPKGPSLINNTLEEGVKHTVSYFVAPGLEAPLAIIYGDVILATESELLEHASTNGTNLNTKRALSLLSGASLWTGGIVRYKWQSEAAKGDGRLDSWVEATTRWTNVVPWLQFKEYPSSSTLSEDILTLVPTIGQQACFSPIGKQSYGQMLLDDECGGAGTYTHELGHTLGLYHEHQRPDRDDYVKIHCENVWDSADGTPPDCSQNCRGYGCNFVKLNNNSVDWSGPYDSLSLMHYSPTEFAKSTGPSIEALPGVPPPQYHNFPTMLDAKRLCKLYPEQCTGVCGDGILDAGEECDDGNNWNGDGCTAFCKKELPDQGYCGDGIINVPGEECDDGNFHNGDGCTVYCKKELSNSNPNNGTDNNDDGLCSVQSCDPWSASSCDITTTCTGLGGATSGGIGKHLCACRHGYRASGHASNDTSIQVRLPWSQQGGRVFVKAGTQCDQLCDDWQLGMDSCKEVIESPSCY